MSKLICQDITEVIRKSEITTEYTEDTEDSRPRELSRRLTILFFWSWIFWTFAAKRAEKRANH